MKKFIRDIKTAPEPAIVLADDQQIADRRPDLFTWRI